MIKTLYHALEEHDDLRTDKLKEVRELLDKESKFYHDLEGKVSEELKFEIQQAMEDIGFRICVETEYMFINGFKFGARTMLECLDT